MDDDLKRRIDNALYIAFMYGNMDGSQHKMWCIDQMVRSLTGGTWDVPGATFASTPEYEEFVSRLQNGEDGPHTYSWNKGVAP